MSKLEDQKALPRRSLYRTMRIGAVTFQARELPSSIKPKRKAKKAKRK